MEPAQKSSQSAGANAAPSAQPSEAAPAEAGEKLGGVESVSAAVPQGDPRHPQASAKPVALACAVDKDCLKLSNYCGGCFCEAGNAKPAPKCKEEERVACFVDPCTNKAARCQEGRCTIIEVEPVR